MASALMSYRSKRTGEVSSVGEHLPSRNKTGRAKWGERDRQTEMASSIHEGVENSENQVQAEWY